jgi:hypothetical protein
MTLDLASRVEGLMPGPLAAVFSGTTRLGPGLEGQVGVAGGVDGAGERQPGGAGGEVEPVDPTSPRGSRG